MFKIGDVVICIDKKYKKKYNLKEKTYKIIAFHRLGSTPKYTRILIFLSDKRYGYDFDKFIKLSDFRKLKLQNIKKNVNN